MEYQILLVLPLQKETYDRESNSIRENVSASEFIGNDFKGLLSETPTGDQPVLTACDSFSKYKIEQPQKHKKPLTVRDTLHSPCWPSAMLFFSSLDYFRTTGTYASL